MYALRVVRQQRCCSHVIILCAVSQGRTLPSRDRTLYLLNEHFRLWQEATSTDQPPVSRPSARDHSSAYQHDSCAACISYRSTRPR